MRLVAIAQLLALLMSVLVDPVTHAAGFTANHSHESFASHFVDSYTHAEAALLHDHHHEPEHGGQNDHTQPSQDSDNHQPGHCHLAFFVVSTAAVLDRPLVHSEHPTARVTSPLDRTLSPPTPPPLPV